MSPLERALFILRETITDDSETGFTVYVDTDEAGSHLTAEPARPDRPEPLRFIIDTVVEEPPKAS